MDYNRGFVQDTKYGVSKVINQTVTGLAETALGDINSWRSVLTANPASLPFDLPPTLQHDIDSINNTIAFTGLKIPPLDMLNSDLKKALGSLANPVLLDLDSRLGSILGDGGRDLISTALFEVDYALGNKQNTKKIQDLLFQIDWLG